MSEKSRIVRPHFRPRTVVAEDGTTLKPPEGWELLPPGDAALTRKVKGLGPSWTVQQKKGRRTFSQGVWAPAENIEAAQRSIEMMRQDPSYQRQKQNAQRRREREQQDYVQQFQASVLEFLNFAETYKELAQTLAKAVSAHATPVGSGTVARTKRISVEERAEAAVIAWMRHNTSAYDRIKVPRVKGARRQLRRQIAARSRELLETYRNGSPLDTDHCPLYKAIQNASTPE
ncbi:MAG: DUF2293 domain-containing protein [Deltaproteobacteria bacterium]|nr:MAG: DUF2293 domain-containing protein [Deltaproteobacteria bacterium]